MGFGPQLVDLDGDGWQDILSGNWVHQIILFRGKPDGTFAPGEPLKDKHGKTLSVDYGVSAFAADLDSDGDLDLLAGTVDRSDAGNVYLIRNDGTSEHPAFAQPEKLLANGRPVAATEGDAAPVAADWDADGKLDLILGCGNGSVIWYKNVGESRRFAFAGSEVLIPAPMADTDRGTRAKICATDWNEDGQLDLLVGDFGHPFDKVLSEEEKQWRDEARSQQAEFLEQWAQTFREYRQLSAQSGGANADSDQVQEALARARADMVRLNEIRSRYHHQEQALKPGKQYHGRVWVFLRRSSYPAADKSKAKPIPLPNDEVSIGQPSGINPVVVGAKLHPQTAKPGSEVTLVIRAKTAADWHIYAVDRSSGPAFPTKLVLNLPPTITEGEAENPQPQPYVSDVGTSFIYEGDFVLRRKLRISESAKAGTVELTCDFTYQACNDEICHAPKTVPLRIKLHIEADRNH